MRAKDRPDIRPLGVQPDFEKPPWGTSRASCAPMSIHIHESGMFDQLFVSRFRVMPQKSHSRATAHPKSDRDAGILRNFIDGCQFVTLRCRWLRGRGSQFCHVSTSQNSFCGGAHFQSLLRESNACKGSDGSMAGRPFCCGGARCHG